MRERKGDMDLHGRDEKRIWKELKKGNYNTLYEKYFNKKYMGIYFSSVWKLEE